MKILFRYNISLMTWILNAHWSSKLLSVTLSKRSMTQTQRNGTKWRRIVPEIPAWVSCWFRRKGVCEDRHAECGSIAYCVLAIGIRRKSGRVDSRCKIVLVKLQNCRVIFRSITCNLSNDKIRYKLHGWEHSPAKQKSAVGNSWALCAIRWRRIVNLP